MVLSRPSFYWVQRAWCPEVQAHCWPEPDPGPWGQFPIWSGAEEEGLVWYWLGWQPGSLLPCCMGHMGA